ncbi:hypothetical protein HOP59_08225 [Halomonas sp. MCCC 1A11058]|uniref:Uncharacterized protein n=1 Tax=Billgrantia aerodenitrificans TaxID=2733483 RepID=A0ABS9ARD7_9GAMM|nr:hypothetical protein [Halomonas aerodenitrificans]
MLAVQEQSAEYLVLVALEQYLQILEDQRRLGELAASGQPLLGKGLGDGQQLHCGDGVGDMVGAGDLARLELAVIHGLSPQAAMTMAMRRSSSS